MLGTWDRERRFFEMRRTARAADAMQFWWPRDSMWSQDDEPPPPEDFLSVGLVTVMMRIAIGAM